MNRLRSWFLRKFCGYIRLSDIVTITVGPMNSAKFDPGKFNPDLVIPTKEVE